MERVKAEDLIRRKDAINLHCDLCGGRNKTTCNPDICYEVQAFQALPAKPPDSENRMYILNLDGTPDIVIESD